MCLWIEMIREVFSHETVVRLILPLSCCLHSFSGRWGRRAVLMSDSSLRIAALRPIALAL